MSNEPDSFWTNIEKRINYASFRQHGGLSAVVLSKTLVNNSPQLASNVFYRRLEMAAVFATPKASAAWLSKP